MNIFSLDKNVGICQGWMEDYGVEIGGIPLAANVLTGCSVVDRTAFVKMGRGIVILPAAELPANERVICSHPLLPYGGLCYKRAYGKKIYDALVVLCDYYRSLGYTRLIYKTAALMRVLGSAEDHLWALYRHQPRWLKSELSACLLPDTVQEVLPVRQVVSCMPFEVDNSLVQEAMLLLAIDAHSDQWGIQREHKIALLSAIDPSHVRVAVVREAGAVSAAAICFRGSRCLYVRYLAGCSQQSVLALGSHVLAEGYRTGRVVVIDTSIEACVWKPVFLALGVLPASIVVNTYDIPL